ncbi:MAG: ABC transporter ATP-binding protein [Myxococcales bacterium]|jgi:ABC-2 type transport system ATP-binding protein
MTEAAIQQAPTLPAAAAEPPIVLESVVKRFGSTLAVDQASLQVPAGGVFGLIGPNGAGKTTTFSIVCGFLSPTSGSVRVLGHRPGDLAALRGRIGALPQDALLPANDPVGHAIAFYAQLQGMPRRKAIAAAQEALERVGMSQWWRVRCGALSHGMAKRVGLAQAFLGSPELVLLDEPTAGLDPKSAFQLREFIKQQRTEGHTIVISSHNLTELEELCDAAAILDHGRVVASGAMQELTRAVAEVRFSLASDAVPEDGLRALPCVEALAFDRARRSLVVTFSPGKHEAEEVIAEVLGVLLAAKVRISGVAKGRKLEERVMELV